MKKFTDLLYELFEWDGTWRPIGNALLIMGFIVWIVAVIVKILISL